MPNRYISLPEYPVKNDLWDALLGETRPIIVYGMGNGADKLFNRLSSLGITPADIFASDGFVRGHSFHGMRVKSFSEIKAEYPDFVILLSFATRLPEVIEIIAKMDREYTLYVPDMPIADVGEYFDKDFYNSHYYEIVKAYESLSDSRSKNTFASIINYKLTGKLEYLEENYSTKDELYSEMPREIIRTIVDVGAYTGDTVREAKGYFPNLDSAIALEPDKKTFKRLMKYVLDEDDINIAAYNVAAYNETREGVIFASGNRNSTVSGTASHENRRDEVDLIRLDELELMPDYIKYDVEGSELEALEGSRETIIRHAPTLLVSLYHRSRDIFSLINYLAESYENYNLYLHRTRCLPAWEINLVLVPKN